MALDDKVVITNIEEFYREQQVTKDTIDGYIKALSSFGYITIANDAPNGKITYELHDNLT
jgi:hypothetical protein